MAAQFLSPLRVEKIGARRWMLTDDLVFKTEILNGYFVAPRGFQTDFASIPRFLWALFPQVGKYDGAAVIHDAAYGFALTTLHTGQRVHLVKSWADKVFYEGMKAAGVNGVSAWLMYRAVARFGDPGRHPLREIDAAWSGPYNPTPVQDKGRTPKDPPLAV